MPPYDLRRGARHRRRRVQRARLRRDVDGRARRAPRHQQVRHLLPRERQGGAAAAGAGARARRARGGPRAAGRRDGARPTSDSRSCCAAPCGCWSTSCPTSPCCCGCAATPRSSARRSRRRREFDHAVSALVEAGARRRHVRADVDARTTTRLLFGMINSIVEWYRPGGALTPRPSRRRSSRWPSTGCARRRSRSERRCRSGSTACARRAPERAARRDRAPRLVLRDQRQHVVASRRSRRSGSEHRVPAHLAVLVGLARLICLAVSVTRTLSPGETGVRNRRFSSP